MLLKTLLQWACVTVSIGSVSAVPTRTSPVGTHDGAIEVPEGTLNLEPRAAQTSQAIHFIGFDTPDDPRIATVLRAIEDAAWLGQMGAQQLRGLTSVRQLPLVFRTFFGPHYTAGNMEAIRGWRPQ